MKKELDTKKGMIYVSIGLTMIFAVMYGFITFFTASEPPVTEKIPGVVRVLIHEPHRISIMVRVENSTEIRMQTFESLYDVRFIADAPDNQDMWVSYTYERLRFQGGFSKQQLEIHIHKSMKDVTGAGWNHGKFGKGQTETIE